MAIASAVVVPAKREYESTLMKRLGSLNGVEVLDSGEKGIAITLEARDTHSLEEISKKINNWDDVVDFQLAYLNWEEVVDSEK